MSRRRKQEEHANHEAWAIPYGDLVTLLLAFFVVMYAISSVNEGKYRVLSDSLNAAFRGTPRADEPIEVGRPRAAPAAVMPIGGSAAPATDAIRRSDGVPHADNVAMHDRIEDPGMQEASASSTDVTSERKLDDLATAVSDVMRSLIDADQLSVRRLPGKVEVEIRTDLLFASGSAQLGSNAVAALNTLGDVLREGSNAIRVEGHTDDRPINTAEFPSNWELSAARAANVVRILAARGVDPQRLSVLGRGQFEPVQPNSSPEGRRANRRVMIVILDELPQRGSLTMLPSRSGSWLPDALVERGKSTTSNPG